MDAIRAERDNFVSEAAKEPREAAEQKLALARQLIEDGQLYSARLVMYGYPDDSKHQYDGREAYVRQGIYPDGDSEGRPKFVDRDSIQQSADAQRFNESKNTYYGETTGWHGSALSYLEEVIKKEDSAIEKFDTEHPGLVFEDVSEEKMDSSTEKPENLSSSDEEKAFRDIEPDPKDVMLAELDDLEQAINSSDRTYYKNMKDRRKAARMRATREDYRNLVEERVRDARQDGTPFHT